MSEWAGRRICVAGIGLSGTAAAEALLSLGAAVTVVDDRTGPGVTGPAERLRALGGTVLLGAARALPPGTDLLVTSPGWRPDAAILVAAGNAGVPVWGEVELAWRLRGPAAAPWLAVTGTNGKTTTVRMLAAILAAAGRRTIAAGNVGTPLVEAVSATPPYDVLAVELSSFQLHGTHSLAPAAAAVLNVAADHLDWHGSFAEYAAAKGRIFAAAGCRIYNADDPVSRSLAAGVARTHGFTLGPPAEGQLGVAGGMLIDRAFGGGELAGVDDVRLPGPHNVANALAAAALARAYGIAPDAVRVGLRGFRPDGHRNAVVGAVAGVTYVDDSKATNPHAAAASLTSYDSVVWIAGGLLKGADVGPLVADAAGRLRGAVLIGRDRTALRIAFARHAPQVPVVEVPVPETGPVPDGTDVMGDAVIAAARLARPGDTVLLAPAAASMDQFRDYAARGDAFTAAVAGLSGGAG